MRHLKRYASAAIVAAAAVGLMPALTPAALAYGANVTADPTSMRLILPDLDPLIGGRMADPFDDHLVPRRAMEHPHEWMDHVVAWGSFACSWFAPCRGWGAGAAFGYYLIQHFDPQPMDEPPGGCAPPNEGNCMHMP